MNNNQNTLEELRLNQNFIMGIVGGFLGAIVGAAVWAGVAIVTNYKIGWLALGIGFLVGIGVRKFGKGIDIKYAIIGALFSFLGCALGNQIINIYFLAEAFNVGMMDWIKNMTINEHIEIFKIAFSGKDIIFYLIAIYEGFRFGRIVVNQQNSSAAQV